MSAIAKLHFSYSSTQFSFDASRISRASITVPFIGARLGADVSRSICPVPVGRFFF